MTRNRAEGEVLRLGWRRLLPYSLVFVVAPVFTFTVGRWLDETLHLPKFPPFPWNLCVGLGVFFSGLAIGIKATRTLYKVGRGLPWGELDQQAQSTRLVTTGLYACCRNPMTFGYSLLPCGMGIMFQSFGMTVFVPTLILAIMIVWLKKWEEPSLEKRFGEAYREYRLRTPFLIPRIKPMVLDLVSPIFTSQPDKARKKLGRLRLLYWGYIGVSLFGLCLLAALTFTVPKAANPALHKQLAGSIFGLICILGAVAGVSPSQCSRTRHFKTLNDHSQESHQARNEQPTMRFKGHHPTCGNFASHVLRFRGKDYCAGCTGLVTGAAISLLGTFVYLYAGVNIDGAVGHVVFWLGFVGVALGLLQYSLSLENSTVHFALNVIFVLGVFLLLVGVNETNGNLFLDLYFLALTVYWIVVRITTSRMKHKKTCSACSSERCVFSF